MYQNTVYLAGFLFVATTHSIVYKQNSTKFIGIYFTLYINKDSKINIIASQIVGICILQFIIMHD